MHSSRLRPDGSRRRLVQITGGVPQQLRRDVYMMMFVLAVVILGLGFTSYMLHAGSGPTVTSGDVQQADTDNDVVVSPGRGRTDTDVGEPRLSQEAAGGDRRQRVPVEKVTAAPEHVQEKQQQPHNRRGEAVGDIVAWDALPPRGDRLPKDWTIDEDAQPSSSDDGDDDNSNRDTDGQPSETPDPTQQVLNHFEARARHEEERKRRHRVEHGSRNGPSIDDHVKNLHQRLKDNMDRTKDGSSSSGDQPSPGDAVAAQRASTEPIVISVVVPLRAGRFPTPLIAAIESLGDAEGRAAGGRRSHLNGRAKPGNGVLLKQLPGDHGASVTVREIVIAVNSEHSLAVETSALAYSTDVVPVRLARYMPSDDSKGACLSNLVNIGISQVDDKATHVLVLHPDLDLTATGTVDRFFASLVAGSRSLPSASRLVKARATNRGVVAATSCAVVEAALDKSPTPPPPPPPEERTSFMPDGIGRPAPLQNGVTLTLEEQKALDGSKRRAWAARSAKNPYQIVHKGYMLSTSASIEGAASEVTSSVFATRYLNGYTANDGRLAELITDVDVVDLDCALLRLDVLHRYGGLPDTGQTTVDLAYQKKSDLSFDRALYKYHDFAEAMKMFFAGISIEDAAALSTDARKILSAALEEVMRREEIVARLYASVGGDEKRPANLPSGEKALEPLRRDYHARGLTKDILMRAKFFIVDAWNDVLIAQNVAGEQERGFEFSLRAQYDGMRIVATNATALRNTSSLFTWLPPKVDAFGVSRYYDYTSYLLTQAVAQRWSTLLHGMRVKLAVEPAMRNDLAMLDPPLRVLWDFVCCQCCGFSNEVQDLLTALQPYVDVHAVPASWCFCPGPAVAVGDAITRMHLPPSKIPDVRDDDLVFIAHRQPSLYAYAVESYFVDGRAGRSPSYVIGRSMYEFDRIHERWVNATRVHADEIWVPANWVRDVFVRSGVSESKVFVVPEAIDVNLWDPALHRTISWPPPTVPKSKMFCNRQVPPSRGANSGGRFVFFSDFKLEPRKGWDVLFDGYRQAFDKDDPVSLYVLTNLFLIGVPRELVDPHNATVLLEVFNAVMAGKFGKNDTLDDSFASDDWGHFCLIVDSVSEEDLVEMYNSMDAYVMPTRGEGWGLPLVQAMSMAKPVLSTTFGGQSQFLTPENSYAIEFETGELPPNTPYSSLDAAPGQRWALPSVKHTALMMKEVVNDRAGRLRRGRQARRDMVANYSYDAVAQVIVQQLQRVRTNIREHTNMREDPLKGEEYQSDAGQLADVTLRKLEDAAADSIMSWNERHQHQAPKPFRRALPTEPEQVHECVMAVTLAHLQVVYQQRGEKIPQELIEKLTPDRERLRGARVARVQRALEAGETIDANAMDLLEFPMMPSAQDEAHENHRQDEAAARGAFAESSLQQGAKPATNGPEDSSEAELEEARRRRSGDPRRSLSDGDAAGEPPRGDEGDDEQVERRRRRQRAEAREAERSQQGDFDGSTRPDGGEAARAWRQRRRRRQQDRIPPKDRRRRAGDGEEPEQR